MWDFWIGDMNEWSASVLAKLQAKETLMTTDAELRHHCHANDCRTPTEPRLFMCLKHWRMVPIEMQNAVWKAYREAPKVGRARNKAYLTACADAVEFVASKEGKDDRNSYRNILNMPNGCTS